MNIRKLINHLESVAIMCGNCREHSEDLIERESWGNDE